MMTPLIPTASRRIEPLARIARITGNARGPPPPLFVLQQAPLHSEQNGIEGACYGPSRIGTNFKVEGGGTRPG